MSADLKALLAAVVAEPSDDVARLVYADCLEEHGNIARAHFIRLQIEAERHHPDSRAYADLTERASALFAEHWIEWWSEVCAAVGLRAPAPKPAGRLGRLARAVGLRSEPGAPYWYGRQQYMSHWDLENGFNDFTVRGIASKEPTNEAFLATTFRRGFPDELFLFQNNGVVDWFTGWHVASPLAAIRCQDAALGSDGPHLGTLRDLSCTGPPDAIHRRLSSPHLCGLDSLAVFLYRRDGVDWTAFASLPGVQRLRRLVLGYSDAYPAEPLPALRAADVVFDGYLAPRVPWLTLHAGQLEELVVRGISFGDFLVSLQAGQWNRLRKLVADASYCDVRRWGAEMFDQVRYGYEALFADANLPALEELRVLEVVWTDDFVDRMVKSPLLKRLKHFACTAQNLEAVSPAVLRRLPEAFDPERIETVRFRTDQPRPELAELTRAFGDRVRLECGPGYYVPK